MDYKKIRFIVHPVNMVCLDEGDIIGIRYEKQRAYPYLVCGKNEFLGKDLGEVIESVNIEGSEVTLVEDGSISIDPLKVKRNLYNKKHPEYQNKKQILVEAGLWEKE